MKVWMKDDMRTTSHGNTNRLRITPAFMTDRYTKLQPVDLKDLPAGTRRIDRVFRRIDLDLVLKTSDRSI